MTGLDMDIPPEWEKIDIGKLRGTIMVVGAPDSGKSTFAKFLYQRLRTLHQKVAFLDGDPGQSQLGPPSTFTMAVNPANLDDLLRGEDVWRAFVGSVSPAGHMLPMLTCANRMTRAAFKAGARVLVYDTCGLVEPAPGGTYLKLAKVDLLGPSVLIAIQRRQELEHLLMPLRHSRRVFVITLPSSPAAQEQDIARRRANRAAKFARYFETAAPLSINWAKRAVLPAPRFSLHRLVALEDIQGFVLGLGIVESNTKGAREVVLKTPVTSLEKLDAIRIGNLKVDPLTFEDHPLPHQK